MTETEINQAIAEALGQWLNFYRDLNACKEMEEVLTRDQAITYASILSNMVGNMIKSAPIEQEFRSDGYDWHATAPQRCEAFLKTIGKWKE